MPFVLEEIPIAKFIICGNGSQETYLKKMAKSFGILNGIKFLEWVPHDKLPKHLASSDIYVSTSLSDSTSTSLLEAMACELPAVVTDVGENKRWIKNGENGFIVPTRDPKLLAEKIIYLIKNENIRKKFGKINREIIKEKADYKKWMREMEKIYEAFII
jgi:glycosyltransferase involved in cell wall biosynthesis